MPDDLDDEFERIVERLDLDEFDLPDDDTPTAHHRPRHEPRHEPRRQRPRQHEELDEELPPELSGRAGDVDPYVPRTGPLDLGLNLAWGVVAGVPLLMMVATMSGILLPRAVAYGAALTFVAAAIYLFSRIPDRRSDDDGDDGAVV